jgi:hypothetical protein
MKFDGGGAEASTKRATSARGLSSQAAAGVRARPWRGKKPQAV